ncbi:hypothetical protein SAMN02745136_04772 [Anaerocolumna jejuensis DSM 15929]|uniref:Lipoprotein n=1 Tax=Anaerocolumna jejuensis DSM 15929 TaxID=1121322 RepID=A0A1M7A732_9FIRM|nr:hypothetical protein [Anaerocolumna jejuensis]SHL38446.1 hypothetical protein SAMN02745136_04772 [Anaerocolumna jejuensis DSM 15929]
MKKKLMVLLMATTMAIGILGGCGKDSKTTSTTGNSNLKQITVSEMLADQMKENDGKVYMFTDTISSSFTVEGLLAEGSLKPHLFWIYDGSILKSMVSSALPDTFAETLSNIATLRESESYNVGLYVLTRDSLDGKFYEENLQITDKENGMTRTGQALKFYCENGYSYHITIDGESYLVLEQREKTYTGNRNYMIIKDTDYSKDKSIMFDTEVNSNKSFTDDNGDVKVVGAPVVIE